MTDAGRLRARLTLQAPVEAADGQGGIARSYAAVGDVWAQIEWLSLRDSVVADANGASQRARITLRSPLDVTLHHRFADADRVYRIVGYRDDGVWIVIDAEMRVE